MNHHNHWTDEEIALTRRAWRMYDMARINKFERVGLYVSISILVTFTAIIGGLE